MITVLRHKSIIMNFGLFNFIITSISIFFLFSCAGKKEKQVAAATTTSGNSIVFKVDGQEVKTSGWNISRFNMGNRVQLNLTTNMHEDKRTLLFNLNGWTPGEYILKQGSKEPNTGYGDYKPDYEDVLASFSFQDGSFLIENIDTVKGLMNASFHGTVKRGDKVFTITDGKVINGALRKGITNY